jgi:hypothetical protein
VPDAGQHARGAPASRREAGAHTVIKGTGADGDRALGAAIAGRGATGRLQVGAMGVGGVRDGHELESRLVVAA